jgi:hypothetical protein
VRSFLGRPLDIFSWASPSKVTMAKDELLTDDYVAGLLAKDAKESSIKYSALGLEAFSSPSKHVLLHIFNLVARY